MNESRPELPPTEAQIRAFTTYMRTGSQKTAATELGIAPQTIKNHLCELYARLGVGGALEAATKLGWVRIPGNNGQHACGWVGYCSRALGHMGHHGGMRSLVKD